MARMIGVWLGLVLAVAAFADPPPPAPNSAEVLRFRLTAIKRVKEIHDLYSAGKYAEAVAQYERLLEAARQTYPATVFPDGAPDLAAHLNNFAFLLEATGAFERALPLHQEALAMNRKLFPPSRFPEGHYAVANSLENLGILFLHQDDFERAAAHLLESLAMRRRLRRDGAPHEERAKLASCLNNVGEVYHRQHAYDKARAHYDEALALFHELAPVSTHPHGTTDLAKCWNNIGSLLQDMGAYEQARDFYERSLAMKRRLFPETKFPDGHPSIANGLANLGSLWRAQGEFDRAQEYDEAALAMRRKLYPEAAYPRGHTDLATSLNNLGVVLSERGHWDKALVYLEQALAMKQKLFPASAYPAGHVEIAQALNNIATALSGRRDLDNALAYYQRATDMRRRLFPKSAYPAGHPDLASSLENLSIVRAHQRDYPRAVPPAEEALAMRDRLYPAARFPNGHPQLVRCLSIAATANVGAGQIEPAQAQLRRTLAMLDTLFPAARYPDGHPDLAYHLATCADLQRALKSYPEAAAAYERALTMALRVAERQLVVMAEGDSLSATRHLPQLRDDYLAILAQVPQRREQAYPMVWQTKAVVSRALELRRVAIRAAGTAQAVKWAQLRDTIRQMERLLLDTGISLADRDRQLSALSDVRDRQERELAQALQIASNPGARDGPGELLKALPRGTVFVDFLYSVSTEEVSRRFAASPREAPGTYSAFVVAAGRPVVQVDLGAADPIDRLIIEWRQAIARGAASAAPRQLRERIWSRLAAHLPADTRTLYLAPDATLTLLPWAALPGAQAESVLLEEFAGGLGMVPHGLILLQQLRVPATVAAASGVLIVGDVDFGAATAGARPAFSPLPGTAAEVRALRELAHQRELRVLTGAAATTKQVERALPQVEVAHLATHGYFAEEQLRADHQRLMEQRRTWKFREKAPEASFVTADPQVWTGLVFADANRPRPDDRGILTGLGVMSLPLEKLRLCVLSGCETGLGEVIGGEGVYGLTRAFHLAGCPNVIASLWNVNDAATAALMAKFYHELWVGQKPPIEALREAQLTIYRHPELIPELAGERGVPKLKEAVAVKTAGASPAARRAATRLWAAFVLSGVGK